MVALVLRIRDHSAFTRRFPDYYSFERGNGGSAGTEVLKNGYADFSGPGMEWPVFQPRQFEHLEVNGIVRHWTTA